MSMGSLNGLNHLEADCVVAAGCKLIAAGLAGAVGQGLASDGAYFVEIMAPEDGRPMFFVSKERGRYVIRGEDGGRLADGRTLDALFAPLDGAMPRYVGYVSGGAYRSDAGRSGGDRR